MTLKDNKISFTLSKRPRKESYQKVACWVNGLGSGATVRAANRSLLTVDHLALIDGGNQLFDYQTNWSLIE